MKLNDYKIPILFLLCVGFFIPIITNCSFTKENILLSLFAGMFTCLLTVFLIDIIEVLRLSSRLRFLASKDDEWIGSDLKGREISKFKIEKEGTGEIEFNSFATIKYLKDNILSIQVKHETAEPLIKQRIWKGVIEINKQVLNVGIVTYKYTDSHEAGSRQVLIHRDREYDYIYLIPLNNTLFNLEMTATSLIPKYNYGVEVFTKKR